MYTLNLRISDRDVELLEIAQERIIVAKPVGGSNPNVAWLSIRPFQEAKITWEEEYGLYASRSEIQNGARIDQLAISPFPIQPRAYYNFNQTFQPAILSPDELGPGDFGTHNLDSRFDHLTFGLHQNARVDQATMEFQPLNAVVGLQQRRLVFTPFTPVHIWTQANLASRTVITTITSQRTIAEFGDGVNELSFQYSSGRFFPVVDGETLRDPEALEKVGVKVLSETLL